jgi:TRAP-type C4-dicarboxylate transport system permease small subunit
MVLISAIFLVGMAIIVGADITLRYVFYRPLGWVKEVSEYTLVGLGFLGAAWILKDDAHVKMDLVLSKVSSRAQTMLNIITSVIGTIIVLIVTWFSLRVTVDFYRGKYLMMSVLEPPKWILLSPIFVGCLILAIQFMRRTYVYIQKWRALSGERSGQ